MAHTQDTADYASLEDALTTLFCLVDDAYPNLHPKGESYVSLKRLSDSKVLTLALAQQLRGVESSRSFLRDAARFFSKLFPGVVGLYPSSLHRRIRKLGRFLEPLRQDILAELTGEPETLLIDSTLIEVIHSRQVSQSTGVEGAGWVRWGSFSLYGISFTYCAPPTECPSLTRSPPPIWRICVLWKSCLARRTSPTKWLANSMGISPTAAEH